MQWSKLKSRVKSLICPKVRNRVDFHLTSYRESHDGADKVWITIDGRMVFSCKHYQREFAEAEAYVAGISPEQVTDFLTASEIHGPGGFGSSIRAYLDMPIADALKSSDPLIRAFSMLDRRVGKRTLESLHISEADHTLVRAFYNLRRKTAAQPQSE